MPFYHQPTHETADLNNPSNVLSPVIDVQGNPKAEYGSYTEPTLGVIWFSQTALNKELKGAGSFYQKQHVLDNDKLTKLFPYKHLKK